MNFALKWDGTSVFWMEAGATRWAPLERLLFPGFDRHCAAHAPAGTPDLRIPFLSALPEPGLVQLWTGLVARTPPGLDLLLRPPPNLPRLQGFEVLEGIIETDWWFGPLLTNLRLCTTHKPITFLCKRPLLVAQPLPRAVYDADLLDGARLEAGADRLSPEDWAAFLRALAVRTSKPGGYKRAVRARRRSRLPREGA